MRKRNSIQGLLAIIAVALLLLSSACASIFRAGRATPGRKVSREEMRYDRITEKAWRSLSKEKYEKAAFWYSMAMQEAPQHASNAYSLAVAYARMGNIDQFWKVLEEAVQRGYDIAWQAEEDPAFKQFRKDTRFAVLIEKMKRKAHDHCMATWKSAELPSPDSVPGFDTLEELLVTYEAESRKQMDGWRLSTTDYNCRWNAIMAKKIASLKRYIRENTEASDLHDAHIALIRSWKDLIERQSSSYWEKDISDEFSSAIDGFLNAFPEAPERNEFEFYKIESVLNGGIPPDKVCFDWEDAPPLNHDEAIPLIEAFIQDGKGSPWVTRAYGLKAVSLYEKHPDDREAAMEAYEEFLMQPQIPDKDMIRYDYLINWYLRPMKFFKSGAPDFTGQTLNGKIVTLSEMRGQVVLLDFWSPG